jgi:diguanylate cyclase (GGDEF)-like protein
VVEYEKYADGLSKDSIDPEIQDFENRIRVLTERLTSALTARSRKIVTQYKREAEFDGLTGLHIRRYFDKRIRRDVETARKKDRALSLIFIDLDDFGQVNKEYGFPTGDQTLRLVASTILESIRDTDWAARYGGEELCIVLPDTDEKNALKIAERVWKRIKKEKISTDDNREFFVTASLGVAELLPSDIDAGDFIQRTSDRTRTAKKNGKDRICIDDTEAILEEE